jgi:transcription-repair coupling factor (superfamily II helicase)
VDEEHRFGVRQKDKIRKFKANLDTLYMSATPIPRTLNMALSKLKEISLIQTSPKERLPVRTIVTPYNDSVIKEAIQREVDRGGQVFYVHNRVQTIDSEVEKLRKLLPHVTFSVGHGQMPERQLETLMDEFVHNKFDVLVSTTIIENGIDIPNSNTIIINRADMFGLSQLYQMRGRVGRSSRRAYAYLLVPKGMSPEAMTRLEAIAEYDYLGAGFQVAMRDLEIRGAGNLLGTKQSGLINTVGINYYNRLLQQAIEYIEMNKDGAAAPVEEEVPLKKINVKQDVYFPSSYINDDTLRIQLYKRMGEFNDISEFEDFKQELADRFGHLPKEAERTIDFYKLKFLADTSGLGGVRVRENALVMEFDETRLPAKAVLGQFITSVTSQVRFDTTKGLKIIVDVDKKLFPEKDNLQQSIEFLKAYKEIIKK